MLATLWVPRLNPVSGLSICSVLIVSVLITTCWRSRSRGLRYIAGALLSAGGSVLLVGVTLPRMFWDADGIISSYVWGVAACWVGFNALSSRSAGTAILGGLTLFLLGWPLLTVFVVGLPAIGWTGENAQSVFAWVGLIVWPAMFVWLVRLARRRCFSADISLPTR